MAVRALVFDVFGTLVDWRTTIARAFAESGVPGEPGELADEWRERFWPVIGDILGGKREWANFDELHAETLGALSNGHTALLVDLSRHGDLRFDCLLSAELTHSYKPAREVYESAPRLLGLEPAEVMLVAAHPLDLEGARRAGLRSAFVDRPLEYGPGSPPREDPSADHSVSDLHELAARLAG